MTMTSRALELFPFIEPGHRFYPQLERWREMVYEHPEYDNLLARLDRSTKTIIHTEIKGQVSARGWALDRFYWSFQYWDASRACLFQALTLNYSARTAKCEWSVFPSDSYLPEAVPFFAQQCNSGSALRCDVLRYVPLRRLTFRVTPATGDSALMIGKFKRRSRFLEAYGRINQIARGVQQSNVSFAVAAPFGIDPARCLYFQEACPGDNLATLISDEQASLLLGRVGAIHHELHTLAIPDVPLWQFDSILLNLQRDISWITFFRPEQARFLSAVQRLLLQQIPSNDPREYVFCHGDFVCSQLLCTDDQWSITDFDLCHVGDRYQEIAALLTSLSYDVALFRVPANAALREEAGEAYLNGYQQHARVSLDRMSLTWYRLCSEIAYLAMALKKDWYTPHAFGAAIERIYDLREELHGALGGHD